MTIVSPNGTLANPTIVTTNTATLVWVQNSSALTDGYQIELYNSAGTRIWNPTINSRTTTSTTTGVLAVGLYYWRIRAFNNTCGTDYGSWSANFYFRINSPPTFTTLRINNADGVVVSGEAGGTTLRNHICQTTFQNSTIPRRAIFEASVNDADGAANISNTATLTWNGKTYTMTKGFSAGTGATMVATVDFGDTDNGTGVYDLFVTATDVYGASTGSVNTNRDWKVWNCQVTVSGGMYDGSAGAVCTTTTGYTTYAGDSFNFKSLRFNQISDNSKIEMTVTRPATYNSGSNNLLWGRTYNNLETDFNYVDGDGMLEGTTPLRRVSGGNMGANYSCNAIDLTNSTMIDPYGSSNSLVVDYSSTVNQDPWWQVEGGGIRMGSTVSNLVPVTCALNTSGCSAAMSVDDILLSNSNGLVSGASIVNNSGCGDLCRIGLGADRYYTANLLNKTYSYIMLRQEYLLKYDEGVVITNDWDIILGDTENKVFFVDGNLVIDSNNVLPTNGFRMVIVSGNITIDPSVTRVDGIFLANTGFIISGANDTQLVIQGVLHSSGGNVRINRTYVDRVNNNTNPAVIIKYRPDIIFSMPTNLTRALSGWKSGI